MTPKEMIEIINLYDKGFEIEYLIKHEPTDKWSKVYEEHLFDFENHEYRKKPEPVSIPITEAQKSLLIPIIWIRDREKNIVGWRKGVGEVSMSDKKEFLFLNPTTECWEEWSEE